MLHRKNRNLHVVREPEDPTDEIIDRIMDELNREDGRLPDMEEEIRKRKIKFRRKVILMEMEKRQITGMLSLEMGC